MRQRLPTMLQKSIGLNSLCRRFGADKDSLRRPKADAFIGRADVVQQTGPSTVDATASPDMISILEGQRVVPLKHGGPEMGNYQREHIQV